MNATYDNNLVNQLRSGSHSAYTNLYKNYFTLMCCYGHQKFPSVSSDIIIDAANDVFLWIWENQKRWNPRYSVKNYLISSMYTRVLLELRNNRSRMVYKDLDICGGAQTPYDCLHNKELGESLVRALNELPEQRHRILMLNIKYGLSYKEIASDLNISVNTVDTQLRRAKKGLKNKLMLFYYSM